MKEPWDDIDKTDPRDDPEPPAERPTIDRMPRVVEYSSRGPGDFVVSGPLYPFLGRGRTFIKVAHAVKWAQRKYGAHRVEVLKESLKEDAVRWAILVRYAP